MGLGELRKIVLDTIKGVLGGKTPLDTAHEVHHLTDDVNKTIYAEDKFARRVGEEAMEKGLYESVEKMKKL